MNWIPARVESAVRKWIEHKDRIKPLEVQRIYGWGVDIAGREPKQDSNLDAHRVNANVNICIRAITDAVASLKWEVVALQNIGGSEREIPDEDHPANTILHNPNPDYTLRELVRHITKSLLGDGNSLLTIERMTGPNDAIEIWPRDPRPPYVEPYIPGGILKGYYFGNDQRSKVFYPKERVIHIRDLDPENPIWGVPRFEAVRVEIYSDYLINEFNKNFFLNGAVLNLMWNPKESLKDAQHQAMVEAFKNAAVGVNKAFRPFFNQFAGEWSTPDQTHRDIAFGELLKSNREKIYGAFGLPPFRGGVMEYANYANALAQDKDFWNNTVKPITSLIEDALNKQLVWRYWDNDVKLRCSFDGVPALVGEPLEQAQIDVLLVNAGILTINEVREKRNLEPLEEPAIKKEPNVPDGNPDEEEEPVPDKDEDEEVGNALRGVFTQERGRLRSALSDYTSRGQFMSRLTWPEEEAKKIMPVPELYARLNASVLPVVINIARQRANRMHKQAAKSGYYIPHERDLFNIKESAQGDFLTLAQEMNGLLQSFLADAIAHRWKLSDLVKRTNGIFSDERLSQTAHKLLQFTIKQANALATAEALGISTMRDQQEV